MTRRYWRKKCPKCGKTDGKYYILICICGYNQLEEKENKSKVA